MNGIRVYVEGGGSKRAGKDALRRGFGRFLEPLRELARSKRLGWKVVACGSRNDAFADYSTAVRQYQDEYVLLLVDSEGAVTGSAHDHLSATDGWTVDAGRADDFHLMVQLMETWLVADPASLAAYYGAGFRPAKLPASSNLEKVSGADVLNSLQSATANCKKGKYCKRHGLELIGLADPKEVSTAAAHCYRLFEVVTQRIAAA